MRKVRIVDVNDTAELVTLVVVVKWVVLCVRSMRATVQLPIPPTRRLRVESVMVHNVGNTTHELLLVVW